MPRSSHPLYVDQCDSDDELDLLLQPGLKPTSENPLLSGSRPPSSQAVNRDGPGDPAPTMSAKPSRSSLGPLRQKIVHSDDLFFDLGDTSEGLMPQTQAQQLELQTLFPDLQPFGVLDVLPSPAATYGEKRSDPTKRAEDKDTGNPSLPVDTPAVTGTPIVDGTNTASEGLESDDIFEEKPSTASPSVASQSHASSVKDKVWTASDDAVLKQLVDRYSTNWALVTECFNSARLSTPMERRTPADCAERWKVRWSAKSDPPVGGDGGVAGMESMQSQMTTGFKRPGSAGGQGASVADEKKRKRYYLLEESIQKAAKKRANANDGKTVENRRQPITFHETHIPYNRLPPLTPLELARMKADKDRRDRDARFARIRTWHDLLGEIVERAKTEMGDADSSQVGGEPRHRDFERIFVCEEKNMQTYDGMRTTS